MIIGSAEIPVTSAGFPADPLITGSGSGQPTGSPAAFQAR